MHSRQNMSLVGWTGWDKKEWNGMGWNLMGSTKDIKLGPPECHKKYEITFNSAS